MKNSNKNWQASDKKPKPTKSKWKKFAWKVLKWLFKAAFWAYRIYQWFEAGE